MVGREIVRMIYSGMTYIIVVKNLSTIVINYVITASYCSFVSPPSMIMIVTDGTSLCC